MKPKRKNVQSKEEPSCARLVSICTFLDDHGYETSLAQQNQAVPPIVQVYNEGDGGLVRISRKSRPLLFRRSIPLGVLAIQSRTFWCTFYLYRRRRSRHAQKLGRLLFREFRLIQTTSFNSFSWDITQDLDLTTALS